MRRKSTSIPSKTEDEYLRRRHRRRRNKVGDGEITKASAKFVDYSGERGLSHGSRVTAIIMKGKGEAAH